MVLARLLLAGLGPQDATAPHWVAVGTASITVLAAAQILRVTGARGERRAGRDHWPGGHLPGPRELPDPAAYRPQHLAAPAPERAAALPLGPVDDRLPGRHVRDGRHAVPAAAAWALTFAAMIASPCTRPRART